MPAESTQQRTAARIALAAMRGKIPQSKLKGASRSMFESMSEAQLEDFAKGPVKKKSIHGM